MKIVLLMFFLFCAGGVHAAERSLVIDLATQTVVFIEDGHVIRAGIVAKNTKRRKVHFVSLKKFVTDTRVNTKRQCSSLYVFTRATFCT